MHDEDIRCSYSINSSLLTGSVSGYVQTIKKLKFAMQESDNHLDADMAMIRIQAL